MKKTILSKSCEICGTVFLIKNISKPSKYCSLNCYHDAQRKGDYKWQSEKRIKNRFVCTYCGKEVIKNKRKKRNGETADYIFCNRECYDRFRKLDSERMCKYCGKTFIALNDKKRAQFCDDTCRRAYFAQKATCYCMNCGQIFYPWTFDKQKGTVILDKEVKTCSPRCKKDYHKKAEILRREKISGAFTGSKHPNWQGGMTEYRGDNWAHQRFLAKKRDKYICQRCGISQKQAIKKYGSGLQVHHKIPYIFFNNDYIKANELDNLISLCRSCHQKEEWKYRREHPNEYKKLKEN